MDGQNEEKTAYPGVYRIDARRWRVRGTWTDPKTGRRRELDRIVTAASARAAAATRAELMATGVASSDPRRRIRLDDFATSWLEDKRARTKASTRRHYASMLDLYISPGLGDYYLDAISPDDVRRWLADQAGTPAVRAGKLKILRMLLADAAAELQIANPAARIPAPRVVVDDESTKVIASADLARLLAWLREHTQYGPIALALACTGMRYSEVAALRWSDVDEAAGTIRIARRYYRGELDTPKSGKARTVPLAPELAGVLRELRTEQVRKQVPGLEAGWIFASTRTGEPVRQVGLASALIRAGDALGLKRRPTPHSFRYSFNDLLRRSASGEVQRAIVGHTSTKMSEHYSHVSVPERQKASAAALALLRSESGDPVGISEVPEKG